ncbi:MAG: hypothetical protein ACJ71Q_09960 [Terriglobales bacterium]|jgi:hypothetical protein
MTFRPGFLLVLLIVLPLCAQIHSPALVKSFDLSNALSRPQTDTSASVAFLTDHVIALLWHAAEPQQQTVSVLEWNGDSLRRLTPDFNASGETYIHADGGDQVLLTAISLGGSPPSLLYSLKTHTQARIPYVWHELVSASGNTAGNTTDKNWTLYRLTPSFRELRSESGVLLAVSDDKIVFRQGDNVRTETVEGIELGSFAVKPETRCATSAVLLSDSLYLQTCGLNEITDWYGKKRLKLALPKDSPTAINVDRSAKRLMFDYSTRHVSVLRSTAETAVAIGSLGAGVTDQKSNGESVRVIDTRSGGECFKWDRKLPEDAASFSHAALSPSGQYVSTAVGGRLEIYRLPEQCSLH